MELCSFSTCPLKSDFFFIIDALPKQCIFKDTTGDSQYRFINGVSRYNRRFTVQVQQQTQQMQQEIHSTGLVIDLIDATGDSQYRFSNRLSRCNRRFTVQVQQQTQQMQQVIHCTGLVMDLVDTTGDSLYRFINGVSRYNRRFTVQVQHWSQQMQQEIHCTGLALELVDATGHIYDSFSNLVIFDYTTEYSFYRFKNGVKIQRFTVLYLDLQIFLRPWEFLDSDTSPQQSNRQG